MRTLERRFNWHGVVLIAVASALIAFALLFRSGGSHPVQAGSVHSASAWPYLRSLLGALGFGALLVVAASAGAWFGYLRLLRRYQSEPGRPHERESPKKT